MARRALILATAVVLAAFASPSLAHVERPTEFPLPPGEVPAYRTTGPTLIVCKGRITKRAIEALPKRAERRNELLHERCKEHGFRDLQAAVNAVTEQGSRILMLPGVYRELPTAGPVSADCASLENERPLSYEAELRCPHVDNLVGIFGDSLDADRE